MLALVTKDTSTTTTTTTTTATTTIGIATITITAIRSPALLVLTGHVIVYSLEGGSE